VRNPTSLIAFFLATVLLLKGEPLAAAPADATRQSIQSSPAEVAAGTKAKTFATAKGASGRASTAKASSYTSTLEGTKPKQGLLKLHYGNQKLFAELKADDLDKDFFVLITIARGIGQPPLLGGYSWGVGNDWVWQFRRVGDQVHVVRRNVRFTAEEGSPAAKAVQLAYTDSVLFSLPITAKGPGGSIVIDLSPVFLSDLPQIGQVLPGFVFSKKKSTWATVEAYPKNVEVQVAATYASKGTTDIESVADTRGVTINVHYSISRLPKTDYQPRLADDRVGYFLTVVKDFSKKNVEDRFVRYVNRWNLEKSDRSADKSPPKEPIVFWLEKTIPFKYRKPIRDGIQEWNKAFEKVGFYNAIEVHQQPDDATWEPGDVRYNTFRWITSSAGFAMGPSRVNPTTGQILDADIIFDADFLQLWKREYETFTPQGIEALTGGAIDIPSYLEARERQPSYLRHGHHAGCACNLLTGMSRQLALGATVSAARKRSPQDLEKLIMQGLKGVAMHEVGHTLGLRHNFKGSTLYSLAELNDVEKTRETGLGASVMDYYPINIVPKGKTQGDYYSTTIGPYDYWAIEYGYKPLQGTTAEKELPELAKIASRSGERELAYLTDEDTRGIDPDPHSNRFDFSNDLLEFAESQAALVAESLPSVTSELIVEGEGFERARRALGVLLSTHGRAMFLASRYVGGAHISRSHKGDTGAAEPFVAVTVEKQRRALQLVSEQMFRAEPFDFSPKLYSKLAASHWTHWGTGDLLRADYPAHAAILMWQERVLDRLLSSLTLTRIHDTELKLPAEDEAFTTVELLTRLTGDIFSEVKEEGLGEGPFTLRKPAIASLRRNLQRSYLDRLAKLALGRTHAPNDCQTIAYSELGRLRTRIDAALQASGENIDRYSQAHLEETSARIGKVIEARFIATP